MKAINTFRREHGLLSIVISTRTADYEAIGSRIRLHSAIQVESLEPSDLIDHLNQLGPDFEQLRTAVFSDPSYFELLETPLMLWLAVFATREGTFAADIGASVEQRRRELLGLFTEAMLRRSREGRHYPREFTLRWLAKLASLLEQKGITEIYLESLDFDWIPSPVSKQISRAAYCVISGLLGGSLFAITSGFYATLAVGLSPAGAIRVAAVTGGLAGLCCSLFSVPAAAFMYLRPSEEARFSLSALSLAAQNALVGGCVFGLLIGMICGAIWGMTRTGIYGGLFLGVVVFCIAGPIFGFLMRLIIEVARLVPATDRLMFGSRSFASFCVFTSLLGTMPAFFISTPVLLLTNDVGLRLVCFLTMSSLGTITGMLLHFGRVLRNRIEESYDLVRERQALRLAGIFALISAVIIALLLVLSGSRITIGALTGALSGHHSAQCAAWCD